MKRAFLVKLISSPLNNELIKAAGGCSRTCSLDPAVPRESSGHPVPALMRHKRGLDSSLEMFIGITGAA